MSTAMNAAIRSASVVLARPPFLLPAAPKPVTQDVFRPSAMRELLERVRRLAGTHVTVALLGETGSGKDVMAHLFHEQSRRADAPFVVFDCGAVPANLMESELFGHERGAFTSAHAAHVGAFERAAGGTLFLDEI